LMEPCFFRRPKIGTNFWYQFFKTQVFGLDGAEPYYTTSI
jgi:hypothetical protein